MVRRRTNAILLLGEIIPWLVQNMLGAGWGEVASCAIAWAVEFCDLRQCLKVSMPTWGAKLIILASMKLFTCDRTSSSLFRHLIIWRASDSILSFNVDSKFIDGFQAFPYCFGFHDSILLSEFYSILMNVLPNVQI